MTPQLQNLKTQIHDKENNIVSSLISTLDLPFINQPKLKGVSNSIGKEKSDDCYRSNSNLSLQKRSKTDDFRVSYQRPTHIEKQEDQVSISMHLKSKSSGQFQQQYQQPKEEDYEDKYQGTYYKGNLNYSYLTQFQKNLSQFNTEDSRQMVHRGQKLISQNGDEKGKTSKSFQKVEDNITTFNKFKINPQEIYKSKKSKDSITEMSFDQLKREAKNLYSVLQNQEKLIEAKSKQKLKPQAQNMNIQQSEPQVRKGFKIKQKPITVQSFPLENKSLIVSNSNNDQMLATLKVNESKSYYLDNESQSQENNASFIEQIRKKFNEHKFMKREDVLKLLKEIQHQEQEKIRQKVFDQHDIFKGFQQNHENRLFNQSQQQYSMQNFKKPFNSKRSIQNEDNLGHLFSISKMGHYDRILNQMNSQKNGNQQKYHSFNLTNNSINEDVILNKKSVESRNSKLKQIKETNSESKSSTFSPLKITKQLQKSQLEEMEKQSTKNINNNQQNENKQITEPEKDDLSDIMQIGFKSLKKFEHKKSQGSKRARSQLAQNLIMGPTNFNNIINSSQTQQFTDNTVFKEVVRGDKLTYTKDLSRLQQELYEVYMKQRLTTAASNHNNYNKTRETQSDQKKNPNKPYTATNNIRAEKKYNSLLNKINQGDENIKDIKSQYNKENALLEGCHQNNHFNLPSAKIKVNLKPYTHLENCEINKVIFKVNQFILSIIKQKIKLGDVQILQLFKFFNMQAPKVNGLLDFSQFKQKEFMNYANSKLLQKLYKTFNSENGNIEPVIGKSNLNYYVGKGNNFYLVRQIIKRRVWWTRASKEDFSTSTNNEEIIQGCSFIWTQWKKPKHLEYLKQNYSNDQIKVYNRLEDNYHLSNKKALFSNIVQYYNSIGVDPFETAIPLTFHIKSMNSADKDYQNFLTAFNQLRQNPNSQNVWIIKPGENTNRGCGIQVSNNLQEIQQILKEDFNRKNQRTFIVQKYIEKPLLINNRKFDIRCYGLMTSINGNQKGYFYKDCYFRTSSKEFSITNLNKYIHLTNDAIQKNSEDYGKYENGNKMSINDFQRYLDTNFGSLSISFM